MRQAHYLRRPSTVVWTSDGDGARIRALPPGAHGAGRHDEGAADLVGSEPEDPGTYDEPINASGAAIVTAAGTGPDSIGGDEQSREQHLRSVSSLLSAMPAGRDFGTFVHRVLERVDFAGPDLQLRTVSRYF